MVFAPSAHPFDLFLPVFGIAPIAPAPTFRAVPVAGFAALGLAAIALVVPVVRAGRELLPAAKAYADSGSFFHGLPRLSSSQGQE